MFKIRTSKYRHVFCDQPKPEVSFSLFVVGYRCLLLLPLPTGQQHPQTGRTGGEPRTNGAPLALAKKNAAATSLITCTSYPSPHNHKFLRIESSLDHPVPHLLSLCFTALFRNAGQTSVFRPSLVTSST